MHVRKLTTLFTIGLYPKYMYVNRGNHEAKDMNRNYGFEAEAKAKHGEQTYKVHSIIDILLELLKTTFPASFLLMYSPHVSWDYSL